MKRTKENGSTSNLSFTTRVVIVALTFVIAFPFNIFSAISGYTSYEAPDGSVPPPDYGTLIALPDIAAADSAATDSAAVMSRLDPSALDAFPDSIYLSVPEDPPAFVTEDSISVKGDSIVTTVVGEVPVDTVVHQYVDTVLVGDDFDPDYMVRDFNPNPTRAVWLSALCPGLGQLYNRRYWKLPIVIGGFMGLAYATDWNNRMLDDYTQAYRDLMDNDPSTNSYMDFYPPNTKEESLNRTWLEKTFKSKKDFYRRNRDLCIICMIGVYLVAMVDAYVDASLAHFDISPDLSMEVHPTVIKDSRVSGNPGIGLQWALNF